MTVADPDPVALLRSGERILAFAGAGVSTGSGVSDSRGPTAHDALPRVSLRLEPDVTESLPSAAAAAIEG